MSANANSVRAKVLLRIERFLFEEKQKQTAQSTLNWNHHVERIVEQPFFFVDVLNNGNRFGVHVTPINLIVNQIFKAIYIAMIVLRNDQSNNKNEKEKKKQKQNKSNN